MIKSAIEKIISLAVPNFKELGGKTYTDKRLIEVKPDPGPIPESFNIKTLSGIADYIKNNLDDETDHVIHIRDYNHVELHGKYDPEFCRRKNYILAQTELKRFPYGQFMDVESFNIALQSYFQKNETFDKLLAIVGNLCDDTSVNLSDDGVTQTATAKIGVVTKADVKLPNPVELIPYETFPELEGISRKFVFRLRKRNGVECALFESGDTKWKLDYIQAIREYFECKLYADADLSEALKISIIA